jgi:hypothetical protein
VQEQTKPEAEKNPIVVSEHIIMIFSNSTTKYNLVIIVILRQYYTRSNEEIR